MRTYARGCCLVLYDGTCGLCHRTVRWLLKRDKKKQLFFAPLQGITAKSFTHHFPQEEGVVLVENFTTANPVFYDSGQAMLRLLWLLGGVWSLVGVLHFLPPFFYQGIYRFIATRRHRYLGFNTSCALLAPEDKERFLE